MGSTLDADVPGKRGLAHFSNASVASNGADAISGMIMIAPQAHFEKYDLAQTYARTAGTGGNT